MEEEKEIKYCDYGCGRVARHQFKNGNWCCEENTHRCPYMRSQSSKSHKDHIPWNKNKTGIYSEETLKRMSEYRRKINKEKHPWFGRHHTDISKKQMSESGKKKKLSEAHKKKIGEKSKGRKWSLETRDKMKKARVGWHHKIETKQKQSELLKKLWRDPEYIKKQLNSHNIFPNKPETVIIDVLSEQLPNMWKFSGDFSVWVDGKNPDFVNENEKLIIEMFGDFWHGEKHRRHNYSDFSTNYEHELQRIQHFEKNGYRCLVIWEHELENIEKVKEKIKLFCNQQNVSSS
jgi:very-short-patch-repair endonuclease